MGNGVQRGFAALPDALTSALFVCAWFAPSLLGPQYVKNLMLTMLIEFVVMHSSGIYAGLSSADLPRGKRVGVLCGLTLFYTLFVAAFAFAFDSVWPLFAFGWLFVSRFIHLWTQPKEGMTARLMGLWAASGVTYVLGAIVTVMIPLPALGLNSAFVASMHLSGSGEWIDRPQTVIVFGALYFGVQSWLKYFMTADANTPNAAPAPSRSRFDR